MAIAERLAPAVAPVTIRPGMATSEPPVAPRAGWRHGPIVAALMVVALVRQLVMVVATPPYRGHDEVAHVGYLWLLAGRWRLPTLGDSLPAALEPFNAFTLNWPAVYTAIHPPLYYVVAWPAYALAGGDWLARLYLLRLVSVPFFLLTVWLAYRLARALFPDDDFMVLTTPAWVAFQPQLAFEGAIVNNDMLSIAAGALLLLLCVTALRSGLTPRHALALGVALGASLLVKATLTVFMPLVAGVALYACWPRPWSIRWERAYRRGVVARGLAVAVPAVLIPLPWYLYLFRTYGDVTAFRAVRELQAGWNVPDGTFAQLLANPDFHLMRLHEYWGYFGWREIPLSLPAFQVVLFSTLFCAFGLVAGGIRAALRWRAGRFNAARGQVAAIALLIAANLLMYGAMVYFGTMFVLTQARYIFPVATATGLLAMLGLRAVLPPGSTRWGAAVTIAGLAAFNLYLLVTLVIPYGYF